MIENSWGTLERNILVRGELSICWLQRSGFVIYFIACTRNIQENRSCSRIEVNSSFLQVQPKPPDACGGVSNVASLISDCAPAFVLPTPQCSCSGFASHPCFLLVIAPFSNPDDERGAVETSSQRWVPPHTQTIILLPEATSHWWSWPPCHSEEQMLSPSRSNCCEKNHVTMITSVHCFCCLNVSEGKWKGLLTLVFGRLHHFLQL